MEILILKKKEIKKEIKFNFSKESIFDQVEIDVDDIES